MPSIAAGGLFPFADGDINQGHPLAPNLVFLGVAFAGGYRDLVTRRVSSWAGPVSGKTGPIFVQHSGTYAGAGWQFGTTADNTQSRAVFTGLNCNPLSAMNMAVACGFMNPISGGVTAGVDRLLTVENPSSLNNGGMELNAFGASCNPRADIGGNGGSNNIISSLVTVQGQAESFCASNNSGTCTLYTRTTTTTTSTTSRTSATGVTQVTFSGLAGSAQRMLIWGMAWNVSLTAAQAALITPLRGGIPLGLVIPNRNRVSPGYTWAA